MNCPKCNALMVKTELEQLSGENVFFEMECPACHFRTTVPLTAKQKKFL